MSIPPQDRLMTDQQAKEVSIMLTLGKIFVAIAFSLGVWSAITTARLNRHDEQIVENKADTVAVQVSMAAREVEYRVFREEQARTDSRLATVIEGQQRRLDRLER